MNTNDLHPSHLQQLIDIQGWTIEGVADDGTDPDDRLSEIYYGLIVRNPATHERRVVWFQRDEEDNGPGAWGVHAFEDSIVSKQEQ